MDIQTLEIQQEKPGKAHYMSSFILEDGEIYDVQFTLETKRGKNTIVEVNLESKDIKAVNKLFKCIFKDVKRRIL